MSAEQITAFALFAFVASVTPGPSNVILVATGGAVGVVRGLPCLAGVISGMAMMMFSVAIGLGSVILEHPKLLTVLNVCGALFLLYLAWKIASADPAQSTDEQKAVGYVGALIFQWVNPKGWLVTISAVSTYLSNDAGNALTQALLFAATFSIAATPSGFIWLSFGAAVNRLLNNNKRVRAFNVTMGVLLAGSVFMILA